LISDFATTMNGTWFSTQQGGECQDGTSTNPSLSLLFNANVAVVHARIPQNGHLKKTGDIAPNVVGRASV
jgi:hypothetical protein